MHLNRTARGRGRDRGISLIEVTIAVVLLGLTIAATLTTLTATIRATATDRDHANAHAWLQTASDMLYARPPLVCGTAPISVQTTMYESTAQATDNPEDWPSANIKVTSLEFWHIDEDPVTHRTVEGWGVTCDTDTNLQKVGLRVHNADGRIVEEVEVIIGGR